MNEFFRQVGNDGQRIWNQMSAMQRMLVGGVAFATIALLMFLVVWAQTPSYGVLFSKLSDQDAGAIVAKLKEQNIPYKLEGSSIEVPAQQVPEVRLEMASAGLPSGGTVGFEMFNNPSFSQTEFDKSVNYQRALEGELARTINAIQGVDHVRVHVVMPKESLFIEDQEDTTASVMLTLDPGVKLSLDQIRTIQHLVSKSVPKLAPEKVFVTDTAGTDYSEEMAKNDPKNLAGTDLSERQLDIKHQYESDLQRKIQGQLDDVLGAGNSVVRVNTVWDFSQQETDSENYTPQVAGQQPIILSEKSKEEAYNGNGANGDGGIVGSTANVPSYQGAQTNNDGTYTNKERTTNYQPNLSKEHNVKPPAVLKDTTVSVAFNAPADASVPAGAIKQRADNIAKMVAASAGITDVQNKVFVNAMPFNTDAADKEAADAAAAARMAMWTKWGTVGGAILLSLLAFGLLIASFRRKQRQDEINAIDEALPRLPSDDLGITLIDDENELLGVDRIQDLAPASPDEQRIADIQKELAAFIKSQPKDAVKLVRAWMTEDD